MSCAGYHLGEAKPSSLKNISAIAVDAFHNDTLYPQVDALSTAAVIKQLAQDGTYTIVNRNSPAAGAILLGTVKDIVRTPARSVNGNVLLTSEFTISLTLVYELTNPKDGTILYRGSVVGTTNFFVSGDLVQDERQAIPIALERAAVRLVNQVTEGF